MTTILRRFKTAPSLRLLFFGGVFLTCGDIAATFWIRGGSVSWLIPVAFFYFFGMIQLISSYKTEDIPVASTVLVIFNVITLSIVGVVIFGETVTTLKVLGLLLCILSLFLLQYGKAKSTR